MRITLGVTADFASLTADNKLNILGIYNEINPPRLPYVLTLLTVVLSFEADPSDYGKDRRIAITLRDPSDRDIVRPSLVQWSVPRPPKTNLRVSANHITGWTTIVLQQAGVHRVAIFVEGMEIRSINLTVNQPQGG